MSRAALRLPMVGPNMTGCSWWVYWPELGALMHMEADLAAKYQAQGALVLLADANEDEVISCDIGGRSLADFAEPDPDQPPFDEAETVWWYSAAQAAPEVYGDGWERVATWLRREYPFPRPEDIAEQLVARLGRWAGGYDIERAGMERLPWRQR